MTQPTDIRRARALRPRALDLFSCAGGAGTGLEWAGFEVDGCDIADRPNYPFPYHRGDASSTSPASSTLGRSAGTRSCTPPRPARTSAR